MPTTSATKNTAAHAMATYIISEKDDDDGDVGAAAKAEVGDAIDGGPVTAVVDDVGAAVGKAVGDRVGAAVGLAVGDKVGAAVGAAVGALVGDVVGTAVGVAVGEAVGAAVGGSVGAAVGAAVGGSVGDAVGASVGCAVGAHVEHDAKQLSLTSCPGGKRKAHITGVSIRVSDRQSVVRSWEDRD